jgi:predicted ester cyclase
MCIDPGRPVRAAALLVPAILLAGALGCGGSQPRREAEAPAPAASKVLTAAERAAWYQECWGHFNSRAWDRFRACYADGVESEQVGSGHPRAKGFDAMESMVKTFTSAFPDVKATVELILVKGETILGVDALTGTHTGPLLGPDGVSVPATNKPVGIYQAHLVRTDPAGSRIVKEEFYSDSGSLMAQIGLNPMPARPVATPAAAAPTVVIAAGTPAELGNIELLRAQMAAYNSHDAKGVSAFSAPDLVLHDMGMPADQTAKESLAGMQAFFSAFPDAKLAPESIWAAGNYVVATGRLEATNTGPMPAMGVRKPTGRAVSLRYLDITHWERGKIEEEWLFYDSSAFMGQLGLVGKK